MSSQRFKEVEAKAERPLFLSPKDGKRQWTLACGHSTWNKWTFETVLSKTESIHDVF